MNEELPYIRHAEECDADTRLLLFQGRDLLLRGDHEYGWPLRELLASGVRPCHCLPLDSRGDGPWAAAVLQRDQVTGLAAQAVSIRSLLFEQGADRFTLIGRASQLSNWYRTHRFCGACGGPTHPAGRQRVLHCTDCDLDYYPRINPCIIVLVTSGRRVLLARSALRNTGFYSCLAGFIEVGETPEQAVRREVHEETGISVDNIRYIESQSWPFPSQLMLGFLADYRGGNIRPDPDEVAEAAWFDLEALPATPAAAISVAGRLIEYYRRQRPAAGAWTGYTN